MFSSSTTYSITKCRLLALSESVSSSVKKPVGVVVMIRSTNTVKQAVWYQHREIQFSFHEIWEMQKTTEKNIKIIQIPTALR
jgi:hypothetical protein